MFTVLIAAFQQSMPIKALVWCRFVCVEAPGVKVSNVQSTVVESRSIQLTWDPVSCSQRLGLQSRYDILVIEASSQTLIVNTSTSAQPPYWLYSLQPYTQYTVRVRYANEYGAAQYSSDVLVTTEPDGSYNARFVNTVHCRHRRRLTGCRGC